jgi:transcriptional regulator with XRE-family HTH domain
LHASHHHEAPDKGIPHDQHVAETHHPQLVKPKSNREIFLETLGRNIKKRRADQSQEKLAKKAGISMKTLKRVEAGTAAPSFDTLYRLSEALGFGIPIDASPRRPQNGKRH